MIEIHAKGARGRTQLDWLDSRHSFSFGDWQDPDRMGFRALRVINEDRVKPGQGFATHGHRDMEIISYVLEGELGHRDGMGNSGVIRPGDVQRMSAGTGIHHSEFNPSPTRPVRFLQIWILPEPSGLAPSYEQKHFAAEGATGRLQLIAAPAVRAAENGVVAVHQDVEIWRTIFVPGDIVTHEIAPGRSVWVQMAAGFVVVNNSEKLGEGDGLAVTAEAQLEIEANVDAELLLFDLA